MLKAWINRENVDDTSDGNGWTALIGAIDAGRSDVVAYLLFMGADINVQPNHLNSIVPYQRAVQQYSGDNRIVMLLLESNDMFDAQMALCHAINSGHIGLLRYLVLVVGLDITIVYWCVASFNERYGPFVSDAMMLCGRGDSSPRIRDVLEVHLPQTDVLQLIASYLSTYVHIISF